MKKNSFMKRAFSVLLVAVILLGQSIPVWDAHALLGISLGGISSGIQGTMIDNTLSALNIDKSSIQNFGHSFNVSDTKKYAPGTTLSFSPTDPKEGQKITAKAFPLYFSNSNDKLFYTWFLKRKDASDSAEDWKTEAMKIIANDGADTALFLPGPDDDDGYDVRNVFGGSDKTNIDKSWCYVKDVSTGVFYELGPTSSLSASFACGTGGYAAKCIKEVMSTGGEIASTGTYKVNGDPICGDSGSVTCPDLESPRCVNPAAGNTFQLTDTVQRRIYPDAIDPITLLATPNYAYDPVVENNMTCSASASPGGDSCIHLFPNATGATTGDGRFTADEERFWGTNPADADTADNGSKDEANVVGLGLDTFTWTYQTGDLLGLIVEGTSMVNTQHPDSSMMVMWAFSGDGCDVVNKGSYNTTIKGYSVNFPTTGMGRNDFNRCMEGTKNGIYTNLIDPLDTGQANSKKIELDVSATPDNPTNDRSGEKAGDTLTAVASITNSGKTDAEVTYEWKVEASNSIGMSGARNITADLKSKGLLPINKGIDLKTISIPLNMGADVLGGFSTADPLYLRLTSTATENFNSRGSRTGKSDVVVKVSNSDKKILAYTANAADTDTGSNVFLGSQICSTYVADPKTAQDAMTNLDRISCRVMKNEIIGLKLSSDSGLSDFSWKVDGKNLPCNSLVSSDSACAGGTEVFIAVTGEPGTTIKVKLDAVDIKTGNVVTLTRMFNIVTPDIVLETADSSSLWPRVVGQYVDLNGTTHDDLSENYFEKYPGNPIDLRARFVPTFAERISTRQWVVNDVPQSETMWNINGTDYIGIDYITPEGDAVGDVTNIALSATLTQPVEKRSALRNIWGINSLQTAEITIGKSVQVTNVRPLVSADSGTKKFYAALSGYVPPVVSFAFRMFLSGGLLLFTVGFLFSLIPETASESVRRE